VREVAEGYECGLSIEKFNDIKEGDVVEVYVMEEVKSKKVILLICIEIQHSIKL